MEDESADVVERPAEITGTERGVFLGDPVRKEGFRVFARYAPLAVVGSQAFGVSG